MAEIKKVATEFTIREAEVLLKALAGFTPSMEDEMISVMLHSRIAILLKKAREGKSEQ